MIDVAASARQYYDNVDNRSADDVVALFTPHATYRRPGYPEFVGRQALLNFYRNDRVIKSGHHDLERIVSQRDIAAVQGCFRGELRDGTPVEVRFVDIFRFDNGMIAERSTYFDAPRV